MYHHSLTVDLETPLSDDSGQYLSSVNAQVVDGQGGETTLLVIPV